MSLKKTLKRNGLVQAVYGMVTEKIRYYTVRRDPRFHLLLNGSAAFSRHENSDHIRMILNWFRNAQEYNKDGGFPFGIDIGKYLAGAQTYGPSYPETSGYILASLVLAQKQGYKQVTQSMLDYTADYLVENQRVDGGYRTVLSSTSSHSLTFDTGQVLCGLTQYQANYPRDDVAECIERAANWMASQIENNGAYKVQSTFFGEQRCYYTRATIGLALAAKLNNREDWRDAAIRNINWAIQFQDDDGWFDRFSFPDGELSNLHGISYTIRGILDTGILFGIEEFVDSAILATNSMLNANAPKQNTSSSFPGHFTTGFRSVSREIIPTGLAQLSIICLKLGRITGQQSYTDFAQRQVENLKTMHLQNFQDPCIDGLLPGSWPLNGRYEPYFLPNWPIKFFLDALLVLEGVDALEVRG